MAGAPLLFAQVLDKSPPVEGPVKGKQAPAGDTDLDEWDKVIGINLNGPQGLRINSVGPGYIRTPLVESSRSPEVPQVLEGKHALNRLGTSAEVSHLVCFLLSEDASFMTGGYYLVDGGYTAV
ncbi:SDR family NAD(P)-dependent oxidoreductase [Arthrobacter sp. V1I9]|uniref:SDR family NAD(P)-dependent oxidoreductase n=1 Tax=Arthrobacter sp. V1I9 TaxID=3042275 RepID=UPI0027D85944|nr:SDR family oxidoreductase [Arthrobacter sp. V1I9]